jgi:catechol 2,3-dioxygenase-like lactoylglutathione lyase family enzyme
MIINHVSIGVHNVERAAMFYDSVLHTLGIERSCSIDNVAVSYGEQFEFWVGSPYDGQASHGNGIHVAFTAPSRSSVDLFYATAIKLGAHCEGKPGLRPEYGQNYYAAYIRDVDGNKIEAVHSY